MSNHRARTWNHRGSKPLDPKLLPLSHHLDGWRVLFSSSPTVQIINHCKNFPKQPERSLLFRSRKILSFSKFSALFPSVPFSCLLPNNNKTIGKIFQNNPLIYIALPLLLLLLYFSISTIMQSEQLRVN